jgi:hypothetical protein
MRTDDALFTPYLIRVAPQSALATELEPRGGTRGETVARKANAAVHVSRTTLKGIHGTLANHGIAIGYVEQEANDEGTCIEFKLTEWPLEHVKWNASREVLETAVRDGGAREDIIHGDGRWVVFRKFQSEPWTQEACILPASIMIWAAHADGLKDWAQASTSHGLAKMLAELPEGMAIQDDDGTSLRADVSAILTMLQDVVSGEKGVGVYPAGTKVNFLANGSTAWQVFSELILNREKAAHLVYLGTNAFLGSTGGAPGVDISELFRVASTILQGDLQALEDGLNTGLYQPWTAINYGDSAYAPKFKYLVPDPDSDKKSAENRSKYERLFQTIDEMKKGGMVVDQKVVDCLCREYGIREVPQLAASDQKATPIALAPTDVAKVVTVNEARRSQGLPPFPDAARGTLTITELDEQNKAKAEADKAKAEAVADANAEIKVEQATPAAPA